MSPETIRKLSENCAREVHVAAGEDVFRGRAREDDIVVLVSGAVALGDDPGDVGVEDAAEPTVVTRPGTTLNSLLDVLEGSLSAHTDERATRLVDAAAEAAAEAAANASKPTRTCDHSPSRVGDAGGNQTIRRGVGGGGGDGAARGIRRGRRRGVLPGESPRADSVADAQPYTLHPTHTPTPTSPLGVRVSRAPRRRRSTVPDDADARRRDCFTANGDGARTPGGTPDRSGRAGPPGSGRVSERIAFSEHRVSDFSGGPGGLPRLRARGAEGGCVLAAVSTRDFHLAAGFQLGVRAPAMRLAGGYHALCHYLCAPSELAALWVDPAPSAAPASGAGASSALTRLLGAAAAAAVDASSLTHALERRGYVPRRGVATTPRRPSRTNPTSPTTTHRRSCRARRRAREGDRPWSSRRLTSRRARLFDADQPPRRCWWSEGRSRGTGPRRASARAPRTRGRTHRDFREGSEADAAAVEEEVEAAEARAKSDGTAMGPEPPSRRLSRARGHPWARFFSSRDNDRR